MTVDTTSGGALALPSEYDDNGLGDLQTSDLVIPRLNIVHKEGQFKDTLSGEQFGELEVVLLGLVKQRIMWHPTVDPDAGASLPMCKSPDFNLGFPTIVESQPKEKRFPWAKSNFTRDAAVVNPTIQGITIETNGHPVLPCASCKFKEWDTHPNGKKPWCGELWTLPVMYRSPGSGEPWTLAIMTIKSSGIAATKKFLSTFARNKSAPYTAITMLSLQMLTRGDTTYCVPVFRRSGNTEREEWQEFADSYRTVREYVRQAPRAIDEDGDDDAVEEKLSSNVWNSDAVGAAATGSEGILEGQVVEPTRQEVKATVAATPPAPAPVDLNAQDTPAPAAPKPAPVAPPAPVAAAAPVPAPAPAAAPAAPVAPAAPADDEDELPF